VHVGLNNRLVDIVKEGYDCTIRTGALADSSLVARNIGTMRWVTCAAPSYIARHGAPRSPDDLARHACIHYLGARTEHPVPWRFGDRGGVREIDVPGRLGFNALEDVAVAATAGLGVCQTISLIAAPFLADGRLVRVLTDWPAAMQPISIIYPASRHVPAKVKAFADFCVAIFPADPGPRFEPGATR
jgi:LysR family transcriptional regulator for bpeEF and oprC